MSISVTVPNSRIHLIKAAEFLSDLAGLSPGDILPDVSATVQIECNLAPVSLFGQTVTLTDEQGQYALCVTDDLTPPADVASAFGLSAPVPVPPPPGTIVTTAAGQVGMIPIEPPLTGLALPPVPPEPPAPLAPPVITSGVKLDKEGLPWDRRIHSGAQTFRQSDGTWKLLKGIDKALVEQVKAELRAAMGQFVPPLPPPVPPAPTLTLVPPLPPTDDKGWPDPPPGVPLAVPLAPPAPDPYPDFVQFCTSNQQAGRLQYQSIVDACTKHGITQLPMLNARHDLIPVIRAELEALCSPT